MRLLILHGKIQRRVVMALGNTSFETDSTHFATLTLWRNGYEDPCSC
jgi:hypothetical protein